jgi:hypothetical protein
MYPSGATLTITYHKDVQLILCDNGSAATLNDIASASTGQDLFKFDSNQKSILRHECLKDASSRHHDIIRVPGSRIVLRIKFVGVKERDKKTPSGEHLRIRDPGPEADVWTKMAYDSG